MSLEALVTHMALVHLLALVVAEDVSLQRVRPGVGFVAQVTLKLLKIYLCVWKVVVLRNNLHQTLFTICGR